MRNFKNIAVVLCVLTVGVLTMSGCLPLLVGAAAGAGGLAWANGDLEQNVNTSNERVHSAVIKALNSLKITVKSDQSDRLKSRVKAEFSDGEGVAVDTDALTEKATKIKVRVGLIGDKQKSEMILNAILKNL